MFFFDVNLFQQGLNRFGAGLGDKAARTVQRSIFTIFFFRQNLFDSQRGVHRIGNDPGYEVNYFFQRFRRDVEQQAHAAWNAAQIPDMRNRSYQFNVTHAFAADRTLGDFYAAAVTDYALIAYFLVFSAIALPVL